MTKAWTGVAARALGAALGLGAAVAVAVFAARGPGTASFLLPAARPGPPPPSAGPFSPTPSDRARAPASPSPTSTGGRSSCVPPPPRTAASPPPSPSDARGRFGAAPRTASRSIGSPQRGRLENGVDLAAGAPAHLSLLGPTRRRGFTFGTAELVTLLADCADAVARAHPGSVLRVGNLSREGGGDIPQSVSHNSGRDADLAFLARTDAGRPVSPNAMVRFDGTGRTRMAAGLELRFDVARNWTLVRLLLSHPAVVVQWIFVAAPLRNMLLDHALRIGEPELLRERARRVLVQPGDSSRHDDHFHVRIACPADDRPACIDGGGRTALARDAQIDTLLRMYRQGSPAEKRYARDMLSLPDDGADLLLPPSEPP